MARRSDHTREEIKAMAIAAGQRIIAEKGFSGFSARQVAREIGYTVGTLYNIFENHDDIILHINAVTLDDMAAFIAKKVSPALQGAKAIRQLAECYLAFAETHYYRWSALFEHNLPPDMKLPDWYAAKLQHLFAMVEQPLLPLTNNNRRKAGRAAKTLWAGIHGICALGLTGKLDVVGAEPIQKLTDSLIDNYLRGLR